MSKKQTFRTKSIKKKTKVARRTNLSSALQSIYEDKVNMETTCNHRCECCEVAMPQLHYSEFLNIISSLWKTWSNEAKVELICSSIEYFFRYEYEKFGKGSLIKPCLLLDPVTKLCKVYKNRPLNCRLYGLWPNDLYDARVEKFAKAYEKHGLKKEDLPLHKQCPFVKRVDDTVPITEEKINELFRDLDKLDKAVGGFSDLQIEQKENYRAFHDWLLLKVFGEEWLSMLTNFILAATKEQAEDQIKQLKDAARKKFSLAMPDMKE